MRDVFGIDALKELGSRPFYIFLVGVLLISVPAGTYLPYVPLFLARFGRGRAGRAVPHDVRRDVGDSLPADAAMVLQRWGIKGVLLAGISAWIVR